MSVVVTDTGFASAEAALADASTPAPAPAPAMTEIAPDTGPERIAALARAPGPLAVAFADPADGRGFTLARLLRLHGYRGHLRARGNLLPDQYPLARRAGFDDVEIDAARAARQPEFQWTRAIHLHTYDYQSRLKGAVWPSNRRLDPLDRGERAPEETCRPMNDQSPATNPVADPLTKPGTDTVKDAAKASPSDAAARKAPTLPDAQTVTEVTHWTDRLFSFRVTRPRSLRFRSGEFVMIGLMGDNGKPLLRAYSIASPAWDDELEFYSIKVPDGPLTSRLQHIKPGDQIILRPKPVGTLVHDALLPGKRIWFFATGTGIAPFASLLRDPQTYEDYDEVILTHTCREVGELEYGRQLIEKIRSDEMLEELIGKGFHEKLRYYPTTTREQSAKMGRITDLMRSGEAFEDLGVPPISPETDRAMVCGNLAFNLELKDMLEGYGLEEGANSDPKTYVVEKAFLD